MGNARSELFDAVERENLESIKKIVDKYPQIIDAPFTDKAQMNALLRTVWRGNLTIVNYLLSRGANVNAQSRI